jgi:hypothetical protein
MMEIVASLVYDSWTEPIPELRSSILKDRHLIYEGGGVILDLLLKKQPDGTCIHIGGQLLPEDASSTSVSDVEIVIQQGAHSCCTHTNALGEFTFHTVPNGALDLAITLKNRRFVVHGLSKSEPRSWRVVSSLTAGGEIE